jgi:hypothetical protein
MDVVKWEFGLSSFIKRRRKQSGRLEDPAEMHAEFATLAEQDFIIDEMGIELVAEFIDGFELYFILVGVWSFFLSSSMMMLLFIL